MEQDHPLRSAFHYLASASAIRAAAVTAASVQVEHYKQLIAEGMQPDQALELTARTSTSLFNSVSNIIAGIAEHTPAIAEAVERLSNIKERDT